MIPSAIILTDNELEEFFPDGNREKLHQLLPELRYLDPLQASNDEFIDFVMGNRPELMITGWKCPNLPDELLPAMKSFLKYICHTGGSVRKLLSKKFIESGIIVSNWGSTVSPNVAEGALLLIMTALRRTSYWSIQMHCHGGWKDNNLKTETLLGRKVGIHGFGVISRELIGLLKPFNCDISVFSEWGTEKMLAEYGASRAVTLEQLFSESDIIVDLAAATPANYHIVNEKLLRTIRPGGVFVNIGRGMVVDEDALARVAAEGQIQVALDVYEVEPLPANSPLRGLNNVTLMPHLGGPTVDFRRNCGAYALSNVNRYLKHEPIESIVSGEIYDRTT
jgi:phosphoglycerate dehydrogenase-like enzyme